MMGLELTVDPLTGSPLADQLSSPLEFLSGVGHVSTISRHNRNRFRQYLSNRLYRALIFQGTCIETNQTKLPQRSFEQMISHLAELVYSTEDALYLLLPTHFLNLAILA